MSKGIQHDTHGNCLLVVDGSNLLFQMFFGMPSRIINKEGKAIHGTLGFVGALLKIIRRVKPTHIVVLFDGEHQNNRKQLDENYKANRADYSQTAEEDTPFSQLPDVYAALDYLTIPHTETTEYETDDIVASYALTLGRDTKIIISSFDSDFFQLITDKVSVLRYRGDQTIICTPDYIKNKFGISPHQYADFKSLTGDPSDNIKGAEKIGPKTAALLLNTFGTLESILAHTNRIEKPYIKESIVRNRERLRTNYALIKLCDNAPLPFSLKEAQYQHRDITTTDVLKEIGLK